MVCSELTGVGLMLHLMISINDGCMEKSYLEYYHEQEIWLLQATECIIGFHLFVMNRDRKMKVINSV